MAFEAEAENSTMLSIMGHFAGRYLAYTLVATHVVRQPDSFLVIHTFLSHGQV